MTPITPYTIRAAYDWLLDNDLTPQLIVDTLYPGVEIPVGFDKNGQIVLNISPSAVRDLVLGIDQITFNTRFNGIATNVTIPTTAVLTIAGAGTDSGITFPRQETVTPPNVPPQTPAKSKAPTLSIVRST